MLCLRTSWGAIVGHARNETRPDSRLCVLLGGFHATGACRHCMLRQGTLLDANSERFNIWRLARIVAAAGRPRRQRGARDQRDCLVHSRGEVSPPKSCHPAKHARCKLRQSEQSVDKRSPPLPSTAQRSRAQQSNSSTAIRSTAQRSEAQHSDSKHSTAGKLMQGKVMAYQAQRGPGG